MTGWLRRLYPMSSPAAAAFLIGHADIGVFQNTAVEVSASGPLPVPLVAAPRLPIATPTVPICETAYQPSLMMMPTFTPRRAAMAWRSWAADYRGQ
ncbi:MAG: hypothetical protein H6668_11785 [Ardenticatenaceae bacterium]|nr:hypothetical protein [Ardenticatenaceae bacterium]